MNRYENFECHTLEDGNLFFCGALPDELRVGAEGFETLWRLHPAEYHVIKMHGRPVATPRWQQAFGADYHYTGQINRALPLPEECLPILTWSRQAIREELNGLLIWRLWPWLDIHGALAPLSNAPRPAYRRWPFPGKVVTKGSLAPHEPLASREVGERLSMGEGRRANREPEGQRRWVTGSTAWPAHRMETGGGH